VAPLARRLPVQLVAAAFVAAAAAAPVAAQPSPGSVLVRYSFDDGAPETGPDTVSVFEHARGTVRLSRAWRWSGETSVELRDAAGDGDFPELQGYFPRLSTGTIYAHFAFLTPTPGETFNVALAGPRGFRLGRDGISFWLKAHDGFLWQVSDGIPRRILELQPFLWYFVDLEYRLEEGVYDLTVRREAESGPGITLSAQVGASGRTDSAVDKFSFVGDVEEDASNAVYYVDDIVIGTDRSITLLPFAAPGRRRFFVLTLAKSASLLAGSPRCLPLLEPGDLGLSAAESGARPPAAWSRGCEALRVGRAADALTEFQAAGAGPPAPIYLASEAIALAALGRAVEADEALARLTTQWRADPRLPVALAVVGSLRGDLGRAEEILRQPAEAIFGVADDAPDATCRRFSETLIPEQYFSALLANGFFDQAASYADRMVAALGAKSSPSSAWIEKRGDAAFLAGDWEMARRCYERAEREGGSATALLKLADVDFQVGDFAAERARRERVYGALR
jgi:tetratricopeptide (TPR) repeat protein